MRSFGRKLRYASFAPHSFNVGLPRSSTNTCQANNHRASKADIRIHCWFSKHANVSSLRPRADARGNATVGLARAVRNYWPGSKAGAVAPRRVESQFRLELHTFHVNLKPNQAVNRTR